MSRQSSSSQGFKVPKVRTFINPKVRNSKTQANLKSVYQSTKSFKKIDNYVENEIDHEYFSNWVPRKLDLSLQDKRPSTSFSSMKTSPKKNPIVYKNA